MRRTVLIVIARYTASRPYNRRSTLDRIRKHRSCGEPAMPNDSLDSRTSSFHSVPAAIWVALVLLAAAAAGLGGALVMHSRDQAAVPTHTAMNTPPSAPETSIAGAGPAQPTGVAGSF